MTDRYLIRPATEADRPLLDTWRRQDHVRRWWGPPDVGPDADDPRQARAATWIAEAGARPLAFIQDYAVADWSPHNLDYLPPGSRGMEVYIGPRSALGRNLGARLVRQHVDHLLGLGVPAVGIDPHPANERARRAFARAGFVAAGGPLETRWGQVVLMHRFA